jgi:carboxylate-amine ligase
MKPTFTIGIEEEYQTVDPVTRNIRSHIHTEKMEEGRMRLQARVKAELHQAVVEVGTSVCTNIKEAKAEVKALRRDMVKLARDNGLRLASAATHPFADWRVQEITPDDRYKNIVEDMQLVARANLIFGLHVHIGIEDRETAIHLMNHARYFVPHILALSTNSPFWLGMNTGLKSYRCKVFDKFPRTNIPDYFPSWGKYENFIKLLIRPIVDNAKIWWTSDRTHSSILWNFASATFPCAWMKPLRWQLSSRPPSPSCTSCTRPIRVSGSIGARWSWRINGAPRATA